MGYPYDTCLLLLSTLLPAGLAISCRLYAPEVARSLFDAPHQKIGLKRLISGPLVRFIVVNRKMTNFHADTSPRVFVLS